jgi:hypothetical protein
MICVWNMLGILPFNISIRPSSRLTEIGLLNSKNIQDELELDARQKNRMSAELDRLKRREPVSHSETILVLDQKQCKRYFEILTRYRLRAYGVQEFFGLPTVMDEFQLSSSDVKAIEDLLPGLQKKYEAKQIKLRDKILKEITEILDDRQRAELGAISNGVLEARIPPLELLVWQLKHIDLFEETVADSSSPDYRGLCVAPVFGFDIDGTFAHLSIFPFTFFKSLSVEDKKKADREGPQEIFHSLRAVFDNPAFVDEMQLTGDQLAEIKRIGEEHDASHEESSSTLKGRDTKLWDSGLDPVFNQHLKLLDELYESGRKRFEAILLPHQKKTLVLISAMRESLKAGLPAALVYGQMGKLLKITRSQKSELLELCKVSLATIETETRAWEEEILRKIAETIGEESRSLLRTALAKQPEFGSVNISKLLKRREGEDGNK